MLNKTQVWITKCVCLYINVNLKINNSGVIVVVSN